MNSRSFRSYREPGNVGNVFIETHLGFPHYHIAGFDRRNIFDADECGFMCQIALDKFIALHTL